MTIHNHNILFKYFTITISILLDISQAQKIQPLLNKSKIQIEQK